ncbi:chemotaxis protein CheD [Rheinheimera sp. 4Y26]|uniref:chemotaxis protein CheD n=1 Tax=Rheinheimera sp. 4Y26 TaxID=2977811 RepID=UPI0021B0C864|nr:chemotaxis protein CheD [Rheinheimera sp. 4Y26]MCT6699386.1 chemotaxis protein CheD [Rheinheimera sp. 4Y26]
MVKPGLPQGSVEIFLQPGEMYFAKGNVRISTLLGSCVSVSCWHNKYKVGGLSHFLLPDASIAADNSQDSRYANTGFELMLSEIRKQGLHSKDFEFKLFGGGTMPKPAASAHHQIGGKNVAAAKQLLEQYQLELKAEHTGGVGYRKLMFDVWSGQVWLKYVALDSP